MDAKGNKYAVVEAGSTGTPRLLRVFQGTAGLNGAQLAEAVDNPELLPDHWEPVHELWVEELSEDDIVTHLNGVFSTGYRPGETLRAGQWLVVQLD
ncbi:MAG: hypothetical protein JWO93_966 [Micrococcaceae bacterium]|jgi:hypothetical protein|nr:hypothetical protein [Micrococcaceae bacterium]